MLHNKKTYLSSSKDLSLVLNLIVNHCETAYTEKSFLCVDGASILYTQKQHIQKVKKKKRREIILVYCYDDRCHLSGAFLKYLR